MYTHKEHAIDVAVRLIGRTNVAKACGVTPPAVRKWQNSGRLPRTEFTGETAYAVAIQNVTGGQVTVAELLKFDH